MVVKCTSEQGEHKLLKITNMSMKRHSKGTWGTQTKFDGWNTVEIVGWEEIPGIRTSRFSAF
jgi:hypothetical protein